ncbi:scarecrow-like protein 18 [Lotus japonicus]|uniref:scarecrow-like protein 18 n=1 Tax=Lotus japonicus TaxID=34305 RepID=UPI00258DD803|nr:scarecrow-like protein 18 [Lotus japonicus]
MQLLGGLTNTSNPPPTTEHEKEDHFSKEQNQQQQQQHDHFSFDNLMFQDFYFEPALEPKAAFQEPKEQKNRGVESSQFFGFNKHLVGSNKQVPPSSLASLDLLKNYGSRFKRPRGQNILSKTKTCASPLKLSTEDILRVAGARFIQHSSSTQWQDNLCTPMHPYANGFSGFSEEEIKDIELAQLLLAAAERVSCQQFERASFLLQNFQGNSPHHGSAVQRVIFHFAQALQERINKENGTTLKGSDERVKERHLIELLEVDTNITILCHQKMPFYQVMQFAGVQAILENVASGTKIHLININIGCGVMCTGLMQALSERQENPVEILKITAVGVANKTKIEETGKRLMSFAESLNLPFSYNMIFVTDMMEIKVEQFDVEDDEAVAVYSPYFLRSLVSDSDSLENLMKVLRKIKPNIMINLGVEANHNSPSFVNRFVEALFYYSAYFDCLDTCMKEEHECRMRIEEMLSEKIRNIVAMEDRERTVRSVKIDVWRRFFARYRMVETRLSESAVYQANLVAKKFACGNSCTIDKNGKCLLIGWKGTPIHSISAWKFP